MKDEQDIFLQVVCWFALESQLGLAKEPLLIDSRMKTVSTLCLCSLLKAQPTMTEP